MDEEFGTMLLYHPICESDQYEAVDKSFREECCMSSDLLCGNFIMQRPINDCTGYEPPDIGEIMHLKS